MCQYTRAGDWKVLQRGGFFGPNASGKSSFIKSLAFAKSFIVNGQKCGKGTGINQFKGYFEDLSHTSVFQFMFYLDGEVYEYGFSLSRRQVHEEWLMILTQDDMAPLFTRTTDENGKTQIDIESRLARKNSKERRLAETLKDSIGENQKNQLFLYKLYDNGVAKAELIIKWFQNILAEDAIHTHHRYRTQEQSVMLSKSRPLQLVERIEQFKEQKEQIYQFSQYPEDEFWIIISMCLPRIFGTDFVHLGLP